MPDKIFIKKEFQIIGEYDVAICGGGPSGLISAIAAARTGAKTVLIERYGYLGGTATASFVTPISTFKNNGNQVIGGIPWEFIERLSLAGGAIDDYENGNVPFDTEIYKLIAQRMIIESGVDLYLHSYITDIVCKENMISHIIICNKSGISAIAAKYIVDCTGDADVCAMCGFPMLDMPAAEELQPASLGFRLGGVNVDLITGLHPRTPNTKFQMLSVREKLNELSATENVPNFGGPWFCTILNDTAGIVNVNITRAAANATDVKSITSAECKLREDVFALFSLLKKHIPAFSDSYLISTATQAGFRESRRIKGKHILTAEEYVNGVHFEDSVARGAHPVDIHHAKNSGQNVIFLNNAGYIPYRSMISDNFKNIIVAGRCISADRAAFASIRVQATAMALGHAAGTSAALCSINNCPVTDINIALLKKTLIKQGAII